MFIIKNILTIKNEINIFNSNVIEINLNTESLSINKCNWLTTGQYCWNCTEILQVYYA